MAIKTFTTGEVLTASDTNTYLANSGLVYVTSATVGSGVTSIPISNAFSSTYKDYRIVISNVLGTVSNAPLQLQLNNSTGSTYKSTSTYMVYGSTAFNAYAPATATVARIGWTDTSNDINVIIDMCSPQIAFITTWNSYGANQTITYQSAGIDASTNQSTGFTITGDTFTGGTITVYGYRKA